MNKKVEKIEIKELELIISNLREEIKNWLNEIINEIEIGLNIFF